MTPDLERGDFKRLVAIGWKEFLDFPEWGIHGAKAKVDTGARTSALGATHCVLEQRGAVVVARLELALYRRRPRELVMIEAPVLGLVVVTTSGGVREERPIIETTMRLGPVEKRIRLTVTNRSSMLIPILLGRQALGGSFVVDVGHKYLLGKRRPARGT